MSSMDSASVSSNSTTTTKTKYSQGSKSVKSKLSPNRPGNLSITRTQSYNTSSRSIGKMSTSSAKRSVFSSEFQPQVVVRDETGKDVTPVSLLSLKPSVLQQHTILMNSSSASPMSVESSDDFEKASTISMGRSFLSWSSKTSVHSGSSTPNTVGGADGSTHTSPRQQEGQQPRADAGQAATPAGTDQVKKLPTQIFEEKELLFNEIDIANNVDLLLEETETIWLLDISASCVEKDGPLAPETVFKNEMYKQMLATKKVQNESYLDRGVQTINFQPKNKEVQIVPPKKKEVGVIATEWDIYDSFAVELEVEESGISKLKQNKTDKDKQDKILMEELDKEPGSWLELDNNILANADVQNEKEQKEQAQLLQSDKLRESLVIAERMVTQNVFHKKHTAYRGASEDLTDEKFSGETISRSMTFLWEFSCHLTEGKNVSCMVWNTYNKDILAVGYGQFEFSKQTDGLVLCWSLKNPKFPERVIKTSVGVTALSFSMVHSSLLAVGLYDGSVLMYDLRNPSQDPTPVLDSGQTDFKHLDPIWQLQWVNRGDERGESLVSISTDGRVVQWSIKKGLEKAELMKLKRVSNHAKMEKKNEAFISRQAGGLCLDFHHLDSNIYLVGTEDGNIHKCSCSYNEQYLENYSSHTGPVYKVKWSPFCPGVFLSCSADWTMKLWDEDSDSLPVMTFESNTAVTDICWSPNSSTIFAAVSANNMLEVWDLEASTLHPTIRLELPSSPSCVLFSENCPVILTGDEKGSVNVYRLHDFSQEFDRGIKTRKFASSLMQSVGIGESIDTIHLDQRQFGVCKLRKIVQDSTGRGVVS